MIHLQQIILGCESETRATYCMAIGNGIVNNEERLLVVATQFTLLLWLRNILHGRWKPLRQEYSVKMTEEEAKILFDVFSRLESRKLSTLIKDEPNI